ncbi:MAG: class I SAM-dependent methyltransferase [Candidatus Marinimicrobia bacterium]|jgi:SAM-dependent methyltransferase|nr:class I SAM-dependent methyltransferase [Candidatus Neomarinimicrobiota bacterium]
MLTNLSREKTLEIISCPTCFSSLKNNDYVCNKCREMYPVLSGTPAPIIDRSIRNYLTTYQDEKKSIKARIKSYLNMPDERLWTLRAKSVIKKILKEKFPDDENMFVVNIGSGVESFYKNIFRPFQGIIRMGIPHDGEVNVYADAMSLPLKNESIDLFISSSVIEHLPNPEKAVSELYRSLKIGGLVYAEIPFIGAYHMAPHDYQRYTISGIESLFNRHGFKMEEKGICSGPITALILLFQHALIEALPLGPLQYITRFILTWILHPFKYLDFLIGQARWGEYLACNFFYLGRKQK